MFRRGFDLHAINDGRPLYETLGFEPTTEMRLKLRETGRRERSRSAGGINQVC